MSKELEDKEERRKANKEPSFDPMKLIRNVGLGVAAGGAIGVVAGVTIGILLNAHVLEWTGVTGAHGSVAANFAVVANGAAAAGDAPQTPSQAAQAASKAADAAVKSAMEAAKNATSVQQAASISHQSAQAASMAAVATAEAAAQFDAAQQCGKSGLTIGVIAGAATGLFASAGIGFKGRYKAVTIKGRRSATGTTTGTGVVTKSGGDAAVLGRAQMTGTAEGSLASEFPHVYDQFINTIELATPEKEGALLYVIKATDRLPRVQQLVEVLTALDLPLNRGDVFLEMMTIKISAEPTREPSHEETSFNVLRSLRYFRQGRSPPKWVEF